jgi:hypothetical protein
MASRRPHVRRANGALTCVRYAGDDDPELSVHVETLVPELVAADWWFRATAV